ncbi:MAG: ParB/RepB/Spo0J family partition protein [Magnetococcales bacterium]|nr:ParB/RepB/Spo0J family partition protein [Magnetococcales bacterium]
MKNSQSGMGQGLAALLGEAAMDDPLMERVHLLLLEQILPNPHQPRQNFSQDALEELALSIREQGVLLPILVRPIKGATDQYRLVAGERRWRAAKLAGLIEIPALVRNWNDRQALEAAILENVQREDLNPVEVARGCGELIDKFGYSHKKAAQRLGKSREAITNLLRLLRLPEETLSLLESGALSPGHARALLRLEGRPEAMAQLTREVMEKGLSVRQTETLARSLSAQQEKPPGAPEPPPDSGAQTPARTSRGRQRDPVILTIENRLAASLRAPVAITHLRGRGRVIVEYATLEELEALTDRLLKGQD